MTPNAARSQLPHDLYTGFAPDRFFQNYPLYYYISAEMSSGMQKDYNLDFLPPFNKDAFIRPIRPWTRFSALLLLGTVGTLIALACIVPYPVTVRATGTLRPKGDLKLVQATAAGTVTAILVRENQSVTQGQIIAQIEDSNLLTQKSQLSGNIQQNQSQLTQIQAQSSTLEIQIGAESRAAERSVASTEAEVSRLEREKVDKQAAAMAELQAAEANLASAKVKLESAKLERDRYKPLLEEGAISETAFKEKMQAVEELSIAVQVAEANLQRAKVALNPSRDAIAQATEKIAEEQARGEATLATLSKQRQELQGRTIDIQNQINRDRKQIQQIERDLRQSAMRSPVSGTVLSLELRNPGQVVQSGALIAKISPSQAPLIVKARVAAADISQFKPCLAQDVSKCQGGKGKVILKFSAYPYPDYGTLYGAVREISSDVKTSPEGGEAYYEVTIQPEKSYLFAKGAKHPLQAGMEVRSDIIGKDETIMRFILKKARLVADF